MMPFMAYTDQSTHCDSAKASLIQAAPGSTLWHLHHMTVILCIPEAPDFQVTAQNESFRGFLRDFNDAAEE